jgi:hypothetical protein
MSLMPKLPGRRKGAKSAPPPPPAGAPVQAAPSSAPQAPAVGQEVMVDLQRRRDQLIARVAELQWDLGGLAYEMAVRNQMKVELLVKRAVALQDADAELAEVERIVRTEETGTAGACSRCGAPHSSGATFCWQCGQSLLEQVSSSAIMRR